MSASKLVTQDAVAALLNDFWPAEAAAAGSQYVNLIARAAVDGHPTNESFVPSEGDHAYGVLEAIQTLTSAATLLVTCVQLRHMIKTHTETRERLTQEIRRELEDEQEVQRLLDKLTSGKE